MAMTNIPSRTNPDQPAPNQNGAATPASSDKVALAVVTTFFFMWGFVTVLNDVLVPHLKSIFDLNYAKVMLIQFAFFSAYFLFSIPSAKVIDWIGYKKTMVVGLCTMGLGALLFIPAASVPVLSIVSRSLNGPGRGHHSLAGRGQSIRRRARPAGHGFQSTESGAGVQFPGDNDRALPRRHAYPERHPPEYGHCPPNVGRRIAGIPHSGSVIGQSCRT